MGDVKLLTGDFVELLRAVGHSTPTDPDLIRLDVFMTEALSSRVHAAETFSSGGYIRWFVDANLRCAVASDLAAEWIMTTKNHKDFGLSEVSYRRLSRSRLQACVSVGALSWIWESRSVATPHDWRLHRMALKDPDDEEHYWRPWVDTIEEAESSYNEYLEQRSREDINLDLELCDGSSASEASSVGSWLAEVSDSGARDFSSYVLMSKKMKAMSISRFGHTSQLDNRNDRDYDDDNDDAYWNRYSAEDPTCYEVGTASHWQVDAHDDDLDDYWCM